MLCFNCFDTVLVFDLAGLESDTVETGPAVVAATVVAIGDDDDATAAAGGGASHPRRTFSHRTRPINVEMKNVEVFQMSFEKNTLTHESTRTYFNTHHD